MRNENKLKIASGNNRDIMHWEIVIVRYSVSKVKKILIFQLSTPSIDFCVWNLVGNQRRWGKNKHLWNKSTTCRIYDPIIENQGYRKGTNQEIYQLFQKAYASAYILKSKKLEQAGHTLCGDLMVWKTKFFPGYVTGWGQGSPLQEMGGPDEDRSYQNLTRNMNRRQQRQK